MPFSYTDLRTALILTVTLSLVYLLARFAEKNKASANLPIVVIILLLALLCGLRGEEIGWDTRRYYADFIQSLQGNDLPMHIHYEIGFRVFVKVILFLTNNVNCVFLLSSFIIVSLIVIRIWEMKRNISFSFSMVCFFCIIYYSLFSGFRQWMGVAIVFFATRYIEKGKYVKYLLLVALASTLHFASIISIISLALFLLFSRQMHGKMRTKILICAILFVGGAAALFALYNLEALEQYRIDRYATGSDVGFMMISRIVLIVLLFVNFRSFSGKMARYSDIDKSVDEGLNARKFHILQYIPFALGFLFGGFFGTSLERVAWPFWPFECAVFGGKQIDKMHWSYLPMKLLIAVITLYSFYCFVIRGTSTLTPYRFFWE